jgi:hypothetical protein
MIIPQGSSGAWVHVATLLLVSGVWCKSATKKHIISPSVPKGTLSLNWPYLYTRLILYRKHSIMNWGQYLVLAKSRVRLKCFHAKKEYSVLSAVTMKISSFWEIMLCNPFKVNRSFGGTFRFHLHCRIISQAWGWFLTWLILPTLRMEATCSSETSADFQRTTRR